MCDREEDQSFEDEADHRFNELMDDLATGHASDAQIAAWEESQRRLAEKYHQDMEKKQKGDS